MKKAVITGALAVSLLLGSSASVYAMSINPPSATGFGNVSGISLPEIKLPEINPPEVDENATDMSAYEQYGLTYNQANGKYYYGGRLVGLFVDEQGRGITFLAQNGEVHVKAVRDSSGNLTGLAELSASEYNTIVSDMENRVNDIEAQLANDFTDMNLPQPLKPDIQGGIAPSDLSQHMNEVTEQIEKHMAEVNARLQQRMNELHALKSISN